MGTLKLQHLNKRFQIISSIDRAAKNGGDIWQVEEGKKQTLQIISNEIDLVNQYFILELSDPPTIDLELPIHFRFYYRNLLFHLNPKDYKISKNKLVCRFPIEARALEKRTNDRFAFAPESEIFLTFIKNSDRPEGDVILAKIIDVSQQGFGIIISNEWQKRLGGNEQLKIKAIDNHLLHQDIFGSLAYVREIDSSVYRCGISLETPLNKETFEYLKRRSVFVLTG